MLWLSSHIKSMKTVEKWTLFTCGAFMEKYRLNTRMKSMLYIRGRTPFCHVLHSTTVTAKRGATIVARSVSPSSLLLFYLSTYVNRMKKHRCFTLTSTCKNLNYAWDNCRTPNGSEINFYSSTNRLQWTFEPVAFQCNDLVINNVQSCVCWLVNSMKL